MRYRSGCNWRARNRKFPFLQMPGGLAYDFPDHRGMGKAVGKSKAEQGAEASKTAGGMEKEQLKECMAEERFQIRFEWQAAERKSILVRAVALQKRLTHNL